MGEEIRCSSGAAESQLLLVQGNEIDWKAPVGAYPFICYRILTQNFSPFSLLSGYAALNMSPMMRAPEVTAPGNSSPLVKVLQGY